MKKGILVIVFIIIIAIPIIYYLLPNRVSVLGFHSIVNYNSNNIMETSVEKFNKEMKFIHDMKLKTLTLEEMNCYMNKKCDIPKNSVLITFDDGYINNYENAFPILKKYNLNAVVFIIGETVENNTEGFFNQEYIEKTHVEYPNIEFASHSYGLHNEEAINYGYDYFKNDFEKQKKIINTEYFAYPYGKYNDELMRVLRENNFKLAFGFGTNNDFRKAYKNDDKYNVPRLSIDSNMPLWKFKLRLLLPF